jgi:hypothetical protein
LPISGYFFFGVVVLAAGAFPCFGPDFSGAGVQPSEAKQKPAKQHTSNILRTIRSPFN